MKKNIVAIKQQTPGFDEFSNIEVAFNHTFYTADAVAGMLSTILNDKDAELPGIDKHTIDSIAYALHVAVRDMDKNFQQLLNLSTQLLRSCK